MIRGKAEKVLEKIEIAARREFLPILGPVKGALLSKVVREIKPKRALEIGTLIGYSAILIGKEMDSDTHLVTIEVDPTAAAMARKNLREAEIPPKVEVLVGDALEVIPRLEGNFDFVFIHAEKSEYFDYLRLLEGKTCRGSIIVADNVEQAPDYADYVRHSGKYFSRYVSNGWRGLEISVKLS